MSMEVSVTSKPIREPWTRAVSLDKPEVARTLTPAMVEGEPRWKQWLAACDNGKTTEDREVELLLALMAASSFPDHVSAPGPASAFRTGESRTFIVDGKSTSIPARRSSSSQLAQKANKSSSALA